MEKVLITGCLGHIGSALTHVLARMDEWDVTGLDMRSWSSALWGLTSHAHYLTQDFADTSIEFLEQFDVVIHLAAITDAANSFGNEHLWKVNVGDTKDFIGRCTEVGIKRFIFPSSTSVYGPQEKTSTPVIEDDDSVLNPQSPYAEGKISVENFLKESGMPYVILRQGTVCGTSPGMRFHTAVNKFCLQAYKGEPITLWKDSLGLVRPYLTLPAICWAFPYIMRDTIFLNYTFNLISANLQLHQITAYVDEACMNLGLPTPSQQVVDTPLINQHSYYVDDLRIRSTIGTDLCRTGLDYPGIDHQIQETMSYLVSGTLNPIWKIRNRRSY